jgi:hypothetical protein
MSLLDMLLLSVPSPPTTMKEIVGARDAQDADSGPTTRTPRAYIRGLVKNVRRGSISARSCASNSADVRSRACRRSEMGLSCSSSSESMTLAPVEGKESA